MQGSKEAREEREIKNVVKGDMFPVVCFGPPRMTIANSNGSITGNTSRQHGNLATM